MDRGEEALTALGDAAELAGVEPQFLLELRRVLMRAHLGQTAEAREALQSLVAEPRVEDDSLPTWAMTLVLETAILVGDREVCSALAVRLAPAANLSVVGVSTCPARLLGAAAALLGEPEKARAYYHQAIEAAGKIRFRPEFAPHIACAPKP